MGTIGVRNIRRPSLYAKRHIYFGEKECKKRNRNRGKEA